MDARWKFRKAASAVGPNGFYRETTRHALAFYPRSDTLIVSFDNMKSRDMPGPKFPWGYKFVEEAGHSHLGIMMSRRNDWFRHPELWEQLTALKNEGFFQQFRNVVFYGSSMGGYGALAFAPLAPGCRVVAFTPQTHLDPAVVPFETRFRNAFARGTWDGPYLDGAEGALSAAQIYVFADPYFTLDAKHVHRLPMDRTLWLKCSWTNHQSVRALHWRGILSDMVHCAWDGTLTEAHFKSHWRATRPERLQTRIVLNEAIQRGHLDLAERTLDGLARSKPEWRFPNVRRSLKAARDLAAAS